LAELSEAGNTVTDHRLTLRELNRATLARQLLLNRAAIPVPDAVERLVGLQAQLPVAPYVGLWTRLRGFQRDDLARLIEGRGVVKATLMRATLHLATAEDYPWLRATLQPAMIYAAETIAKQRDSGDLDLPVLVAMAQEYIAEKPRTFEEISAMLAERWPGRDVGALRYTVRTHLPLVQVPINGGWSYPGKPAFTLAELWLGRSMSAQANLPQLVSRYLAAFGPATVQDLQTWSGLHKLKDAIAEMKADLRSYRDERGRELLDLPDTPLPDADTPAPVRFLPEFDNLLLSHQNRTRVIPDKYHAHIFLAGLRVRAAILVDGYVAGAWKIEKTKGAATLVIEPFEPLTHPDRDALIEEAERLVRFVEGNAKAFDVRFVD
jgi:hypothetical protein